MPVELLEQLDIVQIVITRQPEGDFKITTHTDKEVVFSSYLPNEEVLLDIIRNKLKKLVSVA